MLPTLWEEDWQGLGAQPLPPDPSAPNIISTTVGQHWETKGKQDERNTTLQMVCAVLMHFIPYTDFKETQISSQLPWDWEAHWQCVYATLSLSDRECVLQGVKNVKMWSKTTTTSSLSSKVHSRCGIGLGMRWKLSFISLLSTFSTPAFVQIQVNLPSSPYLFYKQPAGRKGNHCHSVMTISSSASAGSSLSVLLSLPHQAVPWLCQNSCPWGYAVNLTEELLWAKNNQCKKQNKNVIFNQESFPNPARPPHITLSQAGQATPSPW